MRQPAVTLAGVWGRDLGKSKQFAAELGIVPYRNVEELFDDVDAVGFSVPPQVQSELALAAARRGKHLLLEKPIAVSPPAARALADAVAEADVASLVFFTNRFDPQMRKWLAGVAATPGWDGASGLWLGSAFTDGSPFDTPWRHDLGGLWDVGPHALSLLAGSLGPIMGITARPGPRDLVQLMITHESGAVSTYAVSIDTPNVRRNELLVWGEAGLVQAPESGVDAVAAMAAAAGELAELANQHDKRHPCDVDFGRRVVDLLAEAHSQL
jgi:predicted dehydrogenase